MPDGIGALYCNYVVQPPKRNPVMDDKKHYLQYLQRQKSNFSLVV